jgi:hypothetical protein
MPGGFQMLIPIAPNQHATSEFHPSAPFIQGKDAEYREWRICLQSVFIEYYYLLILVL